MRVCFHGLCFSSRRPRVDQETQTVLYGASAVDSLQVTSFFNKSFHLNDEQPTQPKAAAKSPSRTLSGPRKSILQFEKERETVLEGKFTMLDQEGMEVASGEPSFRQSDQTNNNFQHSPGNVQNNGNFGDIASNGNDSSFGANSDAINNNHMLGASTTNQLNSALSQIYLNEMQLTAKETELIQIIQLKVSYLNFRYKMQQIFI